MYLTTRTTPHSPFFFFNDTATTEIYTLSLHDALPISRCPPRWRRLRPHRARVFQRQDRKSTRLNSSHLVISYAVFCLKKKKKQTPRPLKSHAHTSRGQHYASPYLYTACAAYRPASTRP